MIKFRLLTDRLIVKKWLCFFIYQLDQYFTFSNSLISMQTWTNQPSLANSWYFHGIFDLEKFCFQFLDSLLWKSNLSFSHFILGKIIVLCIACFCWHEWIRECKIFFKVSDQEILHMNTCAHTHTNSLWKFVLTKSLVLILFKSMMQKSLDLWL